MADDGDLLDRIKHAARFGNLMTRQHARQRMAERGATAEDVKKAIATATTATDQPDEGTVRMAGSTPTATLSLSSLLKISKACG